VAGRTYRRLQRRVAPVAEEDIRLPDAESRGFEGVSRPTQQVQNGVRFRPGIEHPLRRSAALGYSLDTEERIGVAHRDSSPNLFVPIEQHFVVGVRGP